MKQFYNYELECVAATFWILDLEVGVHVSLEIEAWSLGLMKQSSPIGYRLELKEETISGSNLLLSL